MVNFKPIKSTPDIQIKIETETGHIVKFKIKPQVFIDTDSKEPFFFVEFPAEYIGTFKGDKPMKMKNIKKMLTERSIKEYWEEQAPDLR